MSYEFTPAARRALNFAVVRASGETGGRVDPCGLLLGLLAEEECRAAALLARAGVDFEDVVRRWPQYQQRQGPSDALAGGEPPKIVPELVGALDRVEQRLDELPHPLTLSTEHLLLALLDTSCQVAHWLRERGLSTEQIQAEIYRLHGVEPGPVDADLPELGSEAVSETATRSGRSSKARPPTDAPVIERQPAPSSAADVLRILDAAANRAREALRVIEDYLRFALDDVHLTRFAKNLRHELANALAPIPLSQRLLARDTMEDIGTTLTTVREYQRENVAEVVAAGFSRLTESLRSLEEFAKLEHPESARAIEQIRYRAYTLQRARSITADSRRRLRGAHLYVLIDGRDSVDGFRTMAKSLIDAGVDALQLRDKQLGDRELLQRARLLRELTADTAVLFIVNDRPDLAFLAGADGVHVGQEELSVREVRRIVGLEKLVGVSTHDIEQARRAVLEGANYIGVGPTFPSATKQFDKFPGLELVRQVAAEVTLPAFAIGGIGAENARQVIDAGLRRIAVSGAVLNSPAPGDACEQLLQMLNADPA